MLRIDFWKLKKDTINKGYNSSLSIEESEQMFSRDFPSRFQKVVERNFFLKIQRHIFNTKFEDEVDYENIFGFVYLIKNKENGKRYYGSVYQKTLKDVVLEMYGKALEGNVKHNRILKALMENPYTAFEFKIVVTKSPDDTKIDLLRETERLIVKYNTRDEESGYNIAITRKVFYGE